MDVDAATAWPFAVGGQVSERFEWLTDTMPPTYGMAYTSSIREDPRILLSFDGLESGAIRRWLETLLSRNSARRWHVPLLCDSARTDAGASIGDELVHVATAHRRFVIGGNAMLLVPGAPRLAEVVEIEDVQTDHIALAAPLQRAWPVGAVVVPTIGGWLDRAPGMDRFTGDDVAYSVAFRAAEPMELSASFGSVSYRDLPVFEQAIDWSRDPKYTPDRRVNWLDDGIGPTLLHDQGGMPTPRIEFDIVTQSAAEIAAHRALLAGLAGRHQPIWVPSFARDFRLASVASLDAIDVEWSGYSGAPLEDNRRDIRIDRAGSDPLYRRIDAAAPVGTLERLALDTPLPGDFTADQVTAISFMALCRQAADINVMRFWRYGVIESQLAFEGCLHGL